MIHREDASPQRRKEREEIEYRKLVASFKSRLALLNFLCALCGFAVENLGVKAFGGYSRLISSSRWKIISLGMSPDIFRKSSSWLRISALTASLSTLCNSPNFSMSMLIP